VLLKGPFEIFIVGWLFSLFYADSEEMIALYLFEGFMFPHLSWRMVKYEFKQHGWFIEH
jgi:hypothetical protein